MEKCLESIINQTYKNLEIILINDGSTDNSFRICKRYANKDKRIITVSQENKGVSSARNTGLELATGEYIGFVDSDDYISSTMYEKLISAAEVNDADIVETGVNLVKNNKVINQRKLFSESIRGKELNLKKYLLKENAENYVCNKIYNKRILKRIHFPLYSYSEDYYFNILTHQNTNLKIILPFISYNYVQHNESSTKREFNSKKMDIVTVGINALEEVSKKYPNLAILALEYVLHNIRVLYTEIQDEEKSKDKKYEKLLTNIYKNLYDEWKSRLIKTENGIKFKRKVSGLIFYYSPSLFYKLKKYQIKYKRSS